MNEPGNGQRLIFVGGSPRSGTTLVQNILDSHPHILGGPEFLHLPEIIQLRRTLHDSISRKWIDIICSKAVVDGLLREMIEKLFLPMADDNGFEYYSEKSPMNILSFTELIELFPDAHFIHVVRDPRSIVSSMKKVKARAVDKGLSIPSFTRNLSASIDYVGRCYDAGFAASGRFPEKVMTIVFEKLLESPEEQSKRICDFLSISWNEAMLHPGKKKHMGEQAITENSGEIWYNEKEYYRDPDKENVNKWKTDLTAKEQIKTILAFQKREELKEFGYDFSLGSVTQSTPLRIKSYFFYRWTFDASVKLVKTLLKSIPGLSSAKRRLLAVLH